MAGNGPGILAALPAPHLFIHISNILNKGMGATSLFISKLPSLQLYEYTFANKIINIIYNGVIIVTSKINHRFEF